MKSLYQAVMIAGMLMLGVTQPARAQQSERIVQFRAPFAFQVENTKLPSGEYTILEQSGWVQVQTKAGKNAARVLTMPRENKGQGTVEESHLVFHNYSGHMFLAEIWASGQEQGRELLECKEEQQLAKQIKLAKVLIEAETVAAK
jgi:hypothetical protein